MPRLPSPVITCPALQFPYLFSPRFPYACRRVRCVFLSFSHCRRFALLLGRPPGWLTLRVPSLLHLFLRQASAWSGPICSLPLHRTAANSAVRRHGCGCCGGSRRRVSPAAASPAGPTLGQRRISEDVLAAAADLRLLHGVPAGHDPDVCPLPYGCGAFPVAARHGASTPRPACGRRPRSVAPTPHDPADDGQATGNDPRQVLMPPVLLPVCQLALAAVLHVAFLLILQFVLVLSAQPYDSVHPSFSSSTGLLISWPNNFLLVLYRPSNLRGDWDIELGKTPVHDVPDVAPIAVYAVYSEPAPSVGLVSSTFLGASSFTYGYFCDPSIVRNEIPPSFCILPPIVRRVASRRENRCETMILQDKRRSSTYCAICRISIHTATRTLSNSNRMDTSTLICVFIGICQIHRSGKLREGSYGRIPEEAHKFLQRSYHMHYL